MNRYLVLLGRFAAITLGYAAAVLTASVFMNVVMAGAGVLEASETDDLYRAGLVVSVLVGALFIGYFAFLPAMAAITFAEIAGKRDWLFYAIGGAVVGAVVMTLFWATGEERNNPALAMMVIAAAITGAWVYWLVAGRNAGSWRRHRAIRPTSTPPEES